jgi:alpha-L-fucosidase
VSPWDRHEGTYGSDAYNEFYKNQLRELLTNYGPVVEVWWDGACGEGPNGRRQVYDWDGYTKLVRGLQPSAVIFNMGPDVRWVGNENGLARESEWSVVPKGHMQAHRMGDLGNRKYLVDAEELVWYPAECDVSIRPGWFYHASQDDKVKSVKHLVDIYYWSVGRNSVLLLNIPPDRRGLFHENDVTRLRELRAVLDETFRTDFAAGRPASATNTRGGHSADGITDGTGDTYWTTEEGVLQAALEVDLGRQVTFDRAMVQEMITEGQRIERFKLEAAAAGSWKPIAEATTVGYKRLLRFPEVTTDRVRLTIVDSRDCPTIRQFGLYKASARETEE